MCPWGIIMFKFSYIIIGRIIYVVSLIFIKTMAATARAKATPPVRLSFSRQIKKAPKVENNTTATSFTGNITISGK